MVLIWGSIVDVAKRCLERKSEIRREFEGRPPIIFPTSPKVPGFSELGTPPPQNGSNPWFSFRVTNPPIKYLKAYAPRGIFRQADRRYNSGLFHFEKGDGSAETLDTITLQLSIDDPVVKKVVQSLYYPESPYEFSVLPADILGQIYERFLGKTITIDRQRLRIEEKPEVKKIRRGLLHANIHRELYRCEGSRTVARRKIICASAWGRFEFLTPPAVPAPS
jgi:hypothetical protein